MTTSEKLGALSVLLIAAVSFHYGPCFVRTTYGF